MLIVIIILLCIVVYFFFTRSGDSKVVGKINPEVVAIRRGMLKSTDERVHEQFAMLFAASTVLAAAIHTVSVDEAGYWGMKICQEGATYLDTQFERYGRADVCAFLKNEDPS